MPSCAVVITHVPAARSVVSILVYGTTFFSMKSYRVPVWTRCWISSMNVAVTVLPAIGAPAGSSSQRLLAARDLALEAIAVDCVEAAGHAYRPSHDRGGSHRWSTCSGRRGSRDWRRRSRLPPLGPD